MSYGQISLQRIKISPNGGVSVDSEVLGVSRYSNTEYKYAKNYGENWYDLKGVPAQALVMLMFLSTEMEYCDMTEGGENTSQMVCVDGPVMDRICGFFGWGYAAYRKNLRALRDCGAIYQVRRNIYQINPRYAAKGYWEYSPKHKSGGIRHFIDVFTAKVKGVTVGRSSTAHKANEEDESVLSGTGYTDYAEYAGTVGDDALDDPKLQALNEGEGPTPFDLIAMVDDNKGES